MNINQNAVLHNRFDIEVRDNKTGELKNTAVAYNMILNRWFTTLTQTGGDLYNYIALTAMGFGKGTGTLDPTRKDLFSYLGRKKPTTIDTVFSYPTSYITKEIRIEADEFNGNNITEVGFLNSYADYYFVFVTHALLKDSEGNNIAIAKTDTDVVIIRGTFFVTFNPVGFGARGVYPLPENNGLIKWLFGLASFPNTASFSRYPLSYSSDMFQCFHGTKTANMEDCSRDPQTWRIDYPVITWRDTERNNHTIRTIGINSIGAYSLPDHSVFPPIEVERLPIGVGDGSTKDFNICAPYIVKNSETIYVNDVAMEKGSDYEIDYESNCCDMRENYHSAALHCFLSNVTFGNLVDAPKKSAKYYDPIAWWECYELNKYPSDCVVTEANPIYLDFGESKDCNRLKIEAVVVPVAQIDNLKIQFSSDGTEWTDVPELVRVEQVWYFSLTTARYWRVYIPSYSWTYGLKGVLDERDEHTFGTTFFLGKVVPGLKFMVAPPSGASIQASYQIEQPFKTNNNLLRFTCSILFSRGEGS